MEKKSRSSPSPSSTTEPDESKGFCRLNDDLIQKILSMLPATSFASAACVCKAWKAACTRILSRPKLSSAISLNPSRPAALQEVFDKVLSEPIRPHFAIACVGPQLFLEDVLSFMVEKLGSRTPILFYSFSGIIGRDALTDEFKEGGDLDDEVLPTGVMLTVGFVPGLKVEAIPLLLQQTKARQESVIDKFVMDIKTYISSVSGSTSPLAIILIGNMFVEQKPILEKLDYAMPSETIIVGGDRTLFEYRSGDISRNISSSPKHSAGAVALVFASDRDKAHGMGDIEFHFELSNGVSAIGPRLKVAASFRVEDVTRLSARREAQQEILGGQDMLDEIKDEMENDMEDVDLYIGVTRQRNCYVGSDMPRMVTSLALYKVLEGDEEFLDVAGAGIRTGDFFQFYHPDPKTASQSCRQISSTFRNLKLDWDSQKEAFGGFMFSSCHRGESFFGQPNVDSAPLLENFPGVPLAGTIHVGQIGRYAYPSLTVNEDQEETSVRGHLHVCSTVYLVLSYTSPPTKQ